MHFTKGDVVVPRFVTSVMDPLPIGIVTSVSLLDDTQGMTGTPVTVYWKCVSYLTDHYADSLWHNESCLAKIGHDEL